MGRLDFMFPSGFLASASCRIAATAYRIAAFVSRALRRLDRPPAAQNHPGKNAARADCHPLTPGFLEKKHAHVNGNQRDRKRESARNKQRPAL
jgi:hypothetical protein